MKKVIAVYFPQFHTNALNDIRFGQGYTDWVGTQRAKPLFIGHYQPHTTHSSYLGYYDPRNENVLRQQAELASEYEVYGFAFYHYWMGNATHLLSEPFRVLLNSKIKTNFCLIWANEGWEPQLKISYTVEDMRQHIEYLRIAFNDNRYIRINNRPVFFIYRMVDTPKFVIDMLHEAFPDILLVKIKDVNSYGCEATLDFYPKFFDGICPINDWTKDGYVVFSYADQVNNYVKSPRSGDEVPCVMVAYDNTPRYGGDSRTIIWQASPEKYELWLDNALKRSYNDIVIVNAWNEWGESNHLEPDARYGHEYLEITKRCILRNSL